MLSDIEARGILSQTDASNINTSDHEGNILIPEGNIADPGGIIADPENIPTDSKRDTAVPDESNTTETESITVYIDTPFRRTIDWLSNHPTQPSQYFCPTEPVTMTSKHYLALLDWLVEDARHLLEKLDAFEQSYRESGLRYHNVPHAFRHGKTLNIGFIRLSPFLLHRLAVIFECNDRDHVNIFQDWVGLDTHAKAAIQKVNSAQDLTDVQELRAVQEEVKKEVLEAEMYTKQVGKIVRSLERMVDKVYASMPELEEVDLSNRYGFQGGIFRMWVATFPEVKRDLVTFDELAEDMVKNGVEDGTWWSEN
ncbi:hypothetical protein P280DRAFT_464457 [Massarina eburnea CBS 473.64]|uniref:Uncharacterized protein n=1 Tax=Massarina eburnea CBS 473.64 TaxID=1395130 RepID=A0A6A6SIJ3_9PLEO|nr:hypothetical protein P280DRAFT_464457 [Massarina eburnea CBS 473.64]